MRENEEREERKEDGGDRKCLNVTINLTETMNQKSIILCELDVVKLTIQNEIKIKIKIKITSIGKRKSRNNIM